MSTNPDKGCVSKCKKIYIVSPSEKTTGADKTCLLHGPVHSSEECKVLKEYSKSTPRSGHIKIVKPALAAKQSIIRLLKSTVESRKPT